MRLTPGSTSNRIRLTILANADGTPYTTADHTTLTLRYLRDGAAAATAITLAAGTLGTYSSGGVVHVAGGVYEVGLPDAAVAADASRVEVWGEDSGGATVVRETIEIAYPPAPNFNLNDLLTSSAVNDASATTTTFVTDLTEATDDHYNGAFIGFTSGNLQGQSRKISDYDGTTKSITLATALTEAPADNDEFVILGRSE